MQSVPTTHDNDARLPGDTTLFAVAVKVSPIRKRRVLTHWLITVTCPYGCRRPHIHGSGGPDLRADHGSRVAHCGGRTVGGYTVIVPADMVEAARMAGAA
jgi:hypothetical protein